MPALSNPLWPAGLAAALLVSLSASAGPACTPDEGVCVSPRRLGDKIELWASSKRPCSVTLSLDLQPEGSAVTERTTIIVPEHGTAKVLDRPALRDGKPVEYLFSFHSQCGQRGTGDGYEYGIPFAAGQFVRISQGFHGPFSHHDAANEYAIDFDVPEGTPVFAARDGVVVDVVEKYDRGGPTEPEDDVNVVRIEHVDHSVAEYAHLRHEGATVTVGQRVKRGDLIAYSGNTGRTTGPHLHFAVHVPIDGQFRRSIPIRFLTEDPAVHELVMGREYRRPESERIRPEPALAKTTAARD